MTLSFILLIITIIVYAGGMLPFFVSGNPAYISDHSARITITAKGSPFVLSSNKEPLWIARGLTGKSIVLLNLDSFNPLPENLIITCVVKYILSSFF